MRIMDTDHPFFRPLWVRILLVAFCAAWGIFEYVMGSTTWAVIFLGIGAYAAWGFFVSFGPRAKSDGTASDTEAEKD